VKASPEDQKELLRLQNADTRIQQLAHRSKNLPQRAERNALEPRLAEAKQQVAARTGELEDARSELSRVESDVRVVETRMERDGDRLQQSSSLKDVQGLEQELTALGKRRDDLEEIELTVMERIEEIEDRLVASNRALREVADRTAELDQVIADEAEKLEAEISGLRADRATIAGALPPELVELYEKQRARYGIGAAALVRGVSMGSNVKLTESDLAVIRRAAPDEVTLCPDSGAILVRGEDAGL
jgi:predicted  nucleic acid-binding Zn-ribbon protein